MIKIYFWADGTWCHGEHLEEHCSYMSDDYGILKVPEEFTYEDVQHQVDIINNTSYRR